MSSAVSTEGNRHGTWALALGIVGILALMAPALAVVVFLGAALSVAAVVLGINGVLAFSARRATNRPQAIAGIVLGVVGGLFWLLAIVGMVVGVDGT